MVLPVPKFVVGMDEDNADSSDPTDPPRQAQELLYSFTRASFVLC